MQKGNIKPYIAISYGIWYKTFFRVFSERNHGNIRIKDRDRQLGGPDRKYPGVALTCPQK